MATKSAKRKATKALGHVTIVRRESDDDADKSGVATWALDAGEARGTIMRSLGDGGSPPRFVISTHKHREDGVLEVGPVAQVHTTDFAAVVARTKQLMARCL